MALYTNDAEIPVEKEEPLVQIVHEISAMAEQANEMAKRMGGGLLNDCPEEMRGDTENPLCLIDELRCTRSVLRTTTNSMKFILDRLGI